jgi:hypothetical protein
MRKALGALIAGVVFLLGCQAPDILFTDTKTVTATSDDYSLLWQACRAVLARQYDIVQENERDGVIVARGTISPTVGRTAADPTDMRSMTTEVNVAILQKEGAYEVRVRAVTRSQAGPDFDAVHDTSVPSTRGSLDYNSQGTGANRDHPLEDQIQSQIQTELGFTPAPPKPKK